MALPVHDRNPASRFLNAVPRQPFGAFSHTRHEDNTSLTITVHQEGGEIPGLHRLRFTKIGPEKLISALWGVASVFF
jgi:hypothetical protein